MSEAPSPPPWFKRSSTWRSLGAASSGRWRRRKVKPGGGQGVGQGVTMPRRIRVRGDLAFPGSPRPGDRPPPPVPTRGVRVDQAERDVDGRQVAPVLRQAPWARSPGRRGSRSPCRPTPRRRGSCPARGRSPPAGGGPGPGRAAPRACRTVRGRTARKTPGVLKLAPAECLQALRLQERALAHLGEGPVDRIAGHAETGLGPIRSARARRSARVARTACQVLTAAASASSSTNAAAVARPAPVPPGELPQPIPGRRRAGLHRLVGQVALEVARQAVGRLVSPVAVLLQRLHHDPVQLAAHQPAQPRRLDVRGRPRSLGSSSVRAQPRARPRRLLLADDPQHLQRTPPAFSRLRSSGVVPVSSS